MEKITSFTIDHIKLQPGLYVSRKDSAGGTTVTTFDLRLTSPNEEPVMNTGEMHTIEHLAATYLRNEPQWKDKVLYFGPMSCCGVNAAHRLVKNINSCIAAHNKKKLKLFLLTL